MTLYQKNIKVGILSNKTILFTLNGDYRIIGNNQIINGIHSVSLENGEFIVENDNDKQHFNFPLTIEPVDYENSSFTLHKVVIGIDFHWERKEDQTFKGSLLFINEDDKIRAVNIIRLEDYLLSVISSEMSATSSKEFLKAHAVISRSWVLAQIEKSKNIKEKSESIIHLKDGYLKWYDREDHTNYDVCADDHCQRYQGDTKASTLAVANTIEETYGEILTFNNEVCDTRFYKCCGGVTEKFENVWENIPHPYLETVIDDASNKISDNLSLRNENNAEKWILSSPKAFCNTTDKEVLSQVLNDYDLETTDFYRWKVEYSQQKLQALLQKRINLNLGEIKELKPIERGDSGRIMQLKIIGTKGEKIIGKELEVRKALSDSHLYSSAFVVSHNDIKNDIPQSFTLNGSGWGHGVGLCQIGAAVMAHHGYSYKEILSHYFKKSELKKIY